MMSKDYSDFLCRASGSETIIFKITDNIYSAKSFLNNHKIALNELEMAIKEYKSNVSNMVAAGIEFINNKVFIRCFAYSLKTEDNFIKIFSEIIRRHFPSAKEIYNTSNMEFINFGYGIS